MGQNVSRTRIEPPHFPAQKKKIFILMVLSGEDIGREYILAKEETIVGRADNSDIVIKDSLVSSLHTRLEIKHSPQGSEEVVLTDLGSANGTFLNYAPVSCAVLKDGDKIMIGATILKLQQKDVADQRLLQDLIKLATSDELTGLYNKRHIIALGEEELTRSQRYQRPLAIILLDIDRFAGIKDAYGAEMGDLVLKRIGQALLSCTRRLDKAGRYGETEFLVLLPETRLAEARVVAERLSKKIRALKLTHNGESFGVTVSMGISSRAENTDDLFVRLVERADQALYLAKSHGGDLIAFLEGALNPGSARTPAGNVSLPPLDEI